MGLILYSPIVAIILTVVGFILGVLIDIICYYRKLFTIALYQAPIPLALFMIVWWVSNPFVRDLYAFFFAVGGLLIGLWLNNELLEPFQFYKIRKRTLGLIYIFFSLIFMGFFMGIPALNLLLGVLAGNYLSIRIISNYRKDRKIIINIRQGALYTAIVLFFITLLAGFTAVSDIDNSIILAEQIFNVSFSPNQFIILISLNGVLLVIFQYYLTLFTTKTMLQLWKHRRFRRPGKI